MKKLLIFVVVIAAGCFIYFKVDIKDYIDSFFKKNDISLSDITREPVLGTRQNPFDWSTTEKQIASAPNLPGEGTEIYVRTKSGTVRRANKGEISWAKNAGKQKVAVIPPGSKPETKKVQTTQNQSAIPKQKAVIPPGPKPETRQVQTTQSQPNVPRQKQESSSQEYIPYIPEPPVIMYYGADIGQFPPGVRDWIVNTGFTQTKMESNWMIDPQLKAWWSNDGNAVFFEASYYEGAGTRKTWGEASYPGINLPSYGQYAKYKTLKFEYDLEREVEYLLAHDLVYAEVINFAKQLCREIEYDWVSFSGYRGARPIKTPEKRYAVCDGYSNEVKQKILSLHGVRSVEKWTGPNHAWNVLNLVDGRTLYFDLTWFDNEHINEKTGEIYQTDDYDWENITFNEDLFRHSNVGYGTTTFAHDSGKFDSIAGG